MLQRDGLGSDVQGPEVTPTWALSSSVSLGQWPGLRLHIQERGPCQPPSLPGVMGRWARERKGLGAWGAHVLSVSAGGGPGTWLSPLRGGPAPGPLEKRRQSSHHRPGQAGGAQEYRYSEGAGPRPFVPSPCGARWVVSTVPVLQRWGAVTPRVPTGQAWHPPSKGPFAGPGITVTDLPGFTTWPRGV